MRKYREREEGTYWAVEDGDWEAWEEGSGKACDLCGTVHASKYSRLKVTQELLCMICRLKTTTVLFPKGSEFELKARESREVRIQTKAKPWTQNTKQARIARLMAEVKEATAGGRLVQMSEIEVMAGGHGLTLKDFMKHRNKPTAPRAPMGTVRLDKQAMPGPKSEEDFILDVAVSQVRDEGRSVEDVVEEFEVDEVKLRVLLQGGEI